MCMAIHHHSPLNQFIWALEEMMSWDHASVIEQKIDISDFPPHLFSGHVDGLSLSYITSVCINLEIGARQNLFLHRIAHCEWESRTQLYVGDADFIVASMQI